MSEWRVRQSRRLNRWLFGDDVLFCYTVHTNRNRGAHWLVIELSINLAFYLTRKEAQHCRRCYVWEKRYGNARKGCAARAASR